MSIKLTTHCQGYSAIMNGTTEIGRIKHGDRCKVALFTGNAMEIDWKNAVVLDCNHHDTSAIVRYVESALKASE